MELRSSSVFLDFDGTITLADTGVHLMERLAPPSWLEIEARYKSGAIGSRECLVEQWSMLPGDRTLIETVAGEVPVDEGFTGLVEFLRSAGAEVTIVSDGFGIRVGEIAREARIAALTNEVDWASGTILFPNGDPSCECAACGVCKRGPIREAKRRGQNTILVGDGASDMKAAAEADVVFAKDSLAEWCTAAGVAFRRFANLSEVSAQLS
ncbi:MAG: HAD-IB family phosphatase [Acidimicrobiales bacterium]